MNKIPTHYSLTALGLTSAIGNGVLVHQQQVFNTNNTPIQLNSSFHNNQNFLTAVCKTNNINSYLNEKFQSNFSMIISAAYEQISEAVNNAISNYGSARVGIVIGTSTTGVHKTEAAMSAEALPENFDYFPQEMGSASDLVALLSGAQGPRYTISTACSSSANAFISASQLIENNFADAVIVGGAEALCKMTVQGFNALGIISKTACNPCSLNRDGTVLGEGAALFLMEKNKAGVALLSGASSSDGYHLSAPDPSALGAKIAINSALKLANLNPFDITYLNMHGTGTPSNDAMETKAIYDIFGDQIYCSSTKPFTGHTLGAAAAIELGLCWIALKAHSKNNLLPLPIHLYDGVEDPNISKINLTTTPKNIKSDRAIIMSNSFGFGGSNACLILGNL